MGDNLSSALNQIDSALSQIPEGALSNLTCNVANKQKGGANGILKDTLKSLARPIAVAIVDMIEEKPAGFVSKGGAHENNPVNKKSWLVVIFMTLAMIILSYRFVTKELPSRPQPAWGQPSAAPAKYNMVNHFAAAGLRNWHDGQAKQAREQGDNVGAFMHDAAAWSIFHDQVQHAGQRGGADICELYNQAEMMTKDPKQVGDLVHSLKSAIVVKPGQSKVERVEEMLLEAIDSVFGEDENGNTENENNNARRANEQLNLNYLEQRQENGNYYNESQGIHSGSWGGGKRNTRKNRKNRKSRKARKTRVNRK